MSEHGKFTRRNFVKLCASALTMVSASPHLLARAAVNVQRYPRVRLVVARGKPLRLADLVVGENYLFHYPYISTPCFLVDLGAPTVAGATLNTEEGGVYRWQGGIGPGRSIVAFSAICAHKMTHPARAVSFINYRHQPVQFDDKAEARARRANVIYCCSEKSVYDATDGARVLGGPAPQPLAAIGLEYDEKEAVLYAVNVYGGAMFDKFFETFRTRLELEYLTTNVRQEVAGTAMVVPLAEYCRTQVLC